MKAMQPSELAALAAAGTAPLLLDVREPWELATARLHPDGTTLLHIPMQQVPQRLAEIPTAQPVVCICHHGARSAQVVAFLLRQGHTDVYNLDGGIDAWSLEVDAGVPRY
jgi:rhodanese-related sulfurtransferase